MELNVKNSWRPLRIILIIVLFGLLSQLEKNPSSEMPIELILFGQLALFIWLIVEIVQWLLNRRKHHG